MKSFIVISLIVLFKVIGDVSLSYGLQAMDELELLNPMALLAFGLQTLLSPWVILGMVFLLSYSLLYLCSLSWLDLSFLIPMTASGYVLHAVFAWLLLGEEIASTRWAGTGIITIGVLVVGWGGRERSGRRALLNSFIRRKTKTRNRQKETNQRKR